MAPPETPPPEPAEVNVLEVRGLVVHYGVIQALSGVSLDVPQGKVVALIGANGA
ncbi:MAG TPA: ABC transporter ATP-binding protein, partial [Anaeromyxobacteraceae bacterium]|nr:ABC transporter ATP-binding protein [Anaeromyxobacteraceae bacterium]